MRFIASILSITVACFLGCTSTPEIEPSGPIARFGTTPTIDGVFDEGEWDDAEIVRVDTVEQFRLKHDGENVYFAVRAGGGDLRFLTDTGLWVLHWSAQLGSAEYNKADILKQVLHRPFAYELWELQNESPAVIQETLADYLSANGWAANIAPMGELMQSEIAISLDWLGVNTESGLYAALPRVRVGGGLMMSRNDPRAEELRALPRDELRRRYPSVSWPADSMPNDSLGMGMCPDTIRVDPANYGSIWIDLRM
jgi:hypothetical protein